MTRHLLIFALCFLVGAVVTAAIRTAGHRAYAAEAGSPLAAPVPHAGHGVPAPTAPVAPEAGVPVNTICALCGMPVDPKLPTATYEGRTIGFGCKACPPLFAADPGRYGPAALRNQVVEE